MTSRFFRCRLVYRAPRSLAASLKRIGQTATSAPTSRSAVLDGDGPLQARKRSTPWASWKAERGQAKGDAYAEQERGKR